MTETPRNNNCFDSKPFPFPSPGSFFFFSITFEAYEALQKTEPGILQSQHKIDRPHHASGVPGHPPFAVFVSVY